jgi:methylamine---glutamate N-methyltransferase subunit A
MCGIAGLQLRDPELYPRLGTMLTSMMCEVADRGPDSAGMAVYRDEALDAEENPTVRKGVGLPRQFATEAGLELLAGWQGIAHTRMATESVVTTEGCHPFAVGDDLCLVHNGSFSNHATIRRTLVARGIRCESANDSEVAARFLADRLHSGDSLATALDRLRRTFDGFYTLLISTRDTFAVMRDAIACKPALIAETDRWVAVASEYRALAELPGIEKATITEPEPEEIYTWQR